MAIRVKCSECQQTLKAEERHAGRTVRCPACRAPVTIPPIEPQFDEETLDPFADDAETPAVKEREPDPPQRQKKVEPKAAKAPETPAAPTISEDEVGEWLSEGAVPQPDPAEEFVELPPQSPNWDGTTSTYDIAAMGPDDPPTPRKRRKKS
jgi:hypothetical protein